MTNAALKITTNDRLDSSRLYLVPKNAAVSRSLEHGAFSRSQIAWLTVVLVVLQILDGILTYAGMSTFGLRAEGNPLLRSLMSIVGIIPAIAITKASCIAVIMALCAQAHRISWLPVALTFIAGIYAAAAIVPWSWLLIAEYFA